MAEGLARRLGTNLSLGSSWLKRLMLRPVFPSPWGVNAGGAQSSATRPSGR